MKPSVVLVHLGDFFIEYLNDSIEQILKFNDIQIYVVTSRIHFEKITSNVHLLCIDDIKKSDNHIEFIQSSKRNRDFRGGFWNSVVERFYVIEDVIIEHGLRDVFHFENDVMIYCDLSIMNRIMNDSNIKMAAPFDNDLRCIPSFLYFRDDEVLSLFNKYALQFENYNEMLLIAMFNKQYELIHHLPVIPPDFRGELKSKTGLTTEDGSVYYKNFEKFNSIFDAAAVGQYLGGIDRRNVKIKFIDKIFKRIFRKVPRQKTDKVVNLLSIFFEELQKAIFIKPRRFVNERALYDISLFEFTWEKDESGRSVPFMIYHKRKIKVNNLHIHSKRLSRFRS